ncbi:hypothetical protein SRHO_G00215440 [Serrasalmus rhombeus]
MFTSEVKNIQQLHSKGALRTPRHGHQRRINTEELLSEPAVEALVVFPLQLRAAFAHTVHFQEESSDSLIDAGPAAQALSVRHPQSGSPGCSLDFA